MSQKTAIFGEKSNRKVLSRPKTKNTLHFNQ